MRLQNAPAWNIEYQKYARTQERLISSEAMFQNRLNDGPSSTNSILMFVQGEKITTYLNGEKMQEVTHRKLKEGVIGFIAWQESGTTFCTFRDGWGLPLP